ncbi:MAG: DNA repair protein RecO [Phycisphaerales bacterium]|nr:DNA repair protein RecO [Phycisphaerales bacterium]
MPGVSDIAICVRHWDWSETSQTLSLMTREHGLLRCIAKGSKREKSAFSGGLELCSLGEFNAIIKPSSELALLTSWDLQDPMPMVRRTSERFNACMYAIDLIPRLILDHDPHPEVFDALHTTLDAIGGMEPCDRGVPILAALVWYQWKLLVHTGSKPELRADVATGEQLDDAKVYGFSASYGGVTVDPGPNGPDSVVRVRARTIEVLRALDSGADADGLLGHQGGELERAGRLLGMCISTILGQESPAFRCVYPEA